MKSSGEKGTGMEQRYGIQARKPKPLFGRAIHADVKVLGRALLEGSIDAIKGDWYESVKSFGDGVLQGFGLSKDSPEELAWRLVYTSTRQAMVSLVKENQEFLSQRPNMPETLLQEFENVFVNTNLELDSDFLTRAWQLPFLRALQGPFAAWLRAFGTDEKQAAYIAAQLPLCFGYCLWDEWARHREIYEPLEKALMVPVQRPPNLNMQRRKYLTYLTDTYRHLNLKGLPRLVDAVTQAAGLALNDIYVSRKARPGRSKIEISKPGGVTSLESAVHSLVDLERKLKPFSAIPIERLLTSERAVVILGDPGAGKSTLLKHWALELTTDDLAPLPILVPLNQYAEALKREPQPLRSFICSYFATHCQDLEDLRPLFDHAIENGRAMVLLDGLDEGLENRGAMVHRVDEFVRQLIPAHDADTHSHAVVPGNRVAVTSRFVGYDEAPLTDPRWQHYSIIDWDRPSIKTFVRRWTFAIELADSGGRNGPKVRQDADEEYNALIGNIFSTPSIESLAGNPLLLTILALIKRQGFTLPRWRSKLYDIYLETLIRSWSKVRALDKYPIGPEIDYLSAWYVLGPLGLWLRDSPSGRLGYRTRFARILGFALSRTRRL